jgi:hypothetical protein
VALQRRHGRRHTITVPVRVPRSLGARRVHRLTLRGQGGGGFFADELLDDFVVLFEDVLGGGTPVEPKTVRELAAQVRALHSVPGIYARFDRRDPQLALASDDVGFEGRVRLRLRVTRRARR